MDNHPIHLAAARGDLAEVQSLIIEHPRSMELRDERDCTPLLIAAERGHTEMVEWLLDQGADPEAQDKYRQDALYGASYWGHTAIVSVLLDRVVGVNRRAAGGWVPLMSAARYGHVGIVEILLSRKEIQIDIQSTEDDTALCFAFRFNHPEVIGLLLQAGADPRIAMIDGMTPLDQARQFGLEECIQLLEVSK